MPLLPPPLAFFGIAAENRLEQPVLVFPLWLGRVQAGGFQFRCTGIPLRVSGFCTEVFFIVHFFCPLPSILAEIMLFLQFFAKKFVLFTLVFCRNCAIMEFIT